VGGDARTAPLDRNLEPGPGVSKSRSHEANDASGTQPVSRGQAQRGPVSHCRKSGLKGEHAPSFKAGGFEAGRDAAVTRQSKDGCVGGRSGLIRKTVQELASKGGTRRGGKDD